MNGSAFDPTGTQGSPRPLAGRTGWVLGATAFVVVLVGAALVAAFGDRMAAVGDHVAAGVIKAETMVRFRTGQSFSRLQGPSVRSAKDLAEAIGVNVHLTYDDTPYHKTSAVIAALGYLGVRRVRDYAPDRDNPHPAYAAVAAAGVGFDLFVPKTPASVDAAEALDRRHPGSVVAIEGPNEINNFPVRFEGRTGRAGAEALQRAVFEAVRARPALAHKPVYMFTGYPAGASADLANLHPYTHRGENPVEDLLIAIEQTTRGQPNQPFVVTETGYFTAGSEVGWGGVTPADQARMELEEILDAVRLGARAVYLYELLDGDRDHGKVDQEHHFGLFDTDYRPKPAAVVLHNFMRDLAGPAATSACPASHLPIPTGGASWLLLRDRDAPLRLVVWRGARDLGRTGKLDIRFGRAASRVRSFHPLLREGPDGPSVMTTDLQVAVRDGPVILEVAC